LGFSGTFAASLQVGLKVLVLSAHKVSVTHGEAKEGIWLGNWVNLGSATEEKMARWWCIAAAERVGAYAGGEVAGKLEMHDAGRKTRWGQRPISLTATVTLLSW
jgi:hypothetical protein